MGERECGRYVLLLLMSSWTSKEDFAWRCKKKALNKEPSVATRHCGGSEYSEKVFLPFPCGLLTVRPASVRFQPEKTWHYCTEPNPWVGLLVPGTSVPGLWKMICGADMGRNTSYEVKALEFPSFMGLESVIKLYCLQIISSIKSRLVYVSKIHHQLHSLSERVS